MSSQVLTAAKGTVDDVVARIERMPMATWHLKARIIIGVATFFDGFDAIAIAYVLPVVAPLWGLTPGQIGLLLSASFAGQVLAALVCGWLAERYGRLPVIIWSTLTYSLLSLACAFAWDYSSLLVLRTLQGIGIGAEVPIAMTYLAELTRAQGRGRFLLLYELVFPAGLLAAVVVGAWVVPQIGWRWLFVIGAAPALIVVFMQRMLPESPRWLATHGRYKEADSVVRLIEKSVERSTGKPLPPPAQVVATRERAISFADLFGPEYLRRTLTIWAVWACGYFCVYGLTTWLPSIYRATFKLGVSEALTYSILTQVFGLAAGLICALSIDFVLRRIWFAMAFAGSSLAFFWLWYATPNSAATVMIAASIAYFFITFIAIGVYLYTPEIYPTRARAVGFTASAVWGRIASFIAPNAIAAVMATSGLGSVFLCFAVVAGVGAVVAGVFVTETRFKVLEEISP